MIWCDDDLNRAWFNEQDDYDVACGYALTKTQVAAINLARRGIVLFPISPDTDTGLTPEHLREIRRIITIERPAPPLMLPTPPPIPDAIDMRMWAQRPDTPVCRTCDPDHWWTIFYPGVIKCPNCGRYCFSGTDITDLVDAKENGSK